jgi:hypothetical protein
MDLVLFDWWVWTGGYELWDVEGEPHICEAGDGEHRRYSLDDYKQLFRRFAEVSAAELEEDGHVAEAALAYAREYGLLGFMPKATSPLPDDAPKNRKFEPLRFWASESRQVYLVLQLWATLRAKRRNRAAVLDAAHRLLRSPGWMPEETGRNLPPEGQRQLPFARMVEEFSEEKPEVFAKHVLAVRVGAKLRRLKVGTTVALDEDQGEIRFAIEPRSLLGAIWLHLALGLKAGVEFRPCQVCDRFIEIGLHDTGHRADRVTCSDACRAKLFRERRKNRTGKRADTRGTS